LVIGLIALVNALVFPRFTSRHEGRPTGLIEHPPVSILIPARNEATTIAGTVQALLAQEHANFELLILDDGSDDGTSEIVRRAAGDDPRLRVIVGKPLPRGWLGKTWACHQLALAATHDMLIFTDADVRWLPGALTELLDEMHRSRTDMLAVWPTQETVTWGERLVVPLIGLVIMGYLPVLLVNRTRFPAFAAANGQCLAFRRAAYFAIGGHAAVRSEIVEDMALARRIKQKGLRLWMADANGLIQCRMYRNWHSVRDGFAKNIIAGYGGSVVLLVMAAVFHWLIFLAPLMWAVFEPYRIWALALMAMGMGVRALTAVATRQRIRDAIWMPVSVLLMTTIALRAVWWHWRYGGPRWKGRTIPRRT
jgi:chlorobactene glucosyltransferase